FCYLSNSVLASRQVIIRVVSDNRNAPTTHVCALQGTFRHAEQAGFSDFFEDGLGLFQGCFKIVFTARACRADPYLSARFFLFFALDEAPYCEQLIAAGKDGSRPRKGSELVARRRPVDSRLAGMTTGG